MASKRHIRYKACGRKVRYNTKGEGDIIKGKMFKSNIMKQDFEVCKGLSVYHCKFCGGYHIGHTPRKFLRDL